MKYCYLGNSGLAISRIGLGTLTFGQSGWGTDEAVSHKILDKYIDLGGNFVDTADRYGGSGSEQIIGQWLVGRQRDEMVIATKCFYQTSHHVNSRGLSRKNIIAACESSLRRLKTDYIDLYQMHAPDPFTPIEETIDALTMLVRQGKVRYVGLSNFPGWQVSRFCYVSQQRQGIPVVAGQYLYNLLKRDIESEIVPACDDAGAGVICWSPLSGGMLSGKYANCETPPRDSRIYRRQELTSGHYNKWYEASWAIVEEVNNIARTHSVAPATVALSWVLSKPGVSAAIVGASSPGQLIENCAAGDWDIPEVDRVRLDSLSVRPEGYPGRWIADTVKDWYDGFA